MVRRIKLDALRTYFDLDAIGYSSGSAPMRGPCPLALGFLDSLPERPSMKVVSVPIIEIDGQPTQKQFFDVHEKPVFTVYSHRDPSVVILRFLNRSISVDGVILQDAIKDVLSAVLKGASPFETLDPSKRSKLLSLSEGTSLMTRTFTRLNLLLEA